MNFTKVIGCFLILFSFVCNAQKITSKKDIMVYLENNGTTNQYSYAYDEMLKMLSNKFPETSKNATGWSYLRTNKDKAITEIKTLLVPVYEDNFEHDDMQKMIAFYQKGAGRQLIEDRTKLTEKQKEELNNFYSSEVGKKIISKQEVLTNAIGKISEAWSRDLYETALSLLKE